MPNLPWGFFFVCFFEVFFEIALGCFGVIGDKIPSFRAPGTFSSSALRVTQIHSSGSTPGFSRGAPKRGNSGIREFRDLFGVPLFRPLRQAGISAAASVPGAGD